MRFAESNQSAPQTRDNGWPAAKRVTVSEVYSIITERIIALLEQGTVPWQKPWNGGEQAPQNLVTRKPYRGVNVFLLNAAHYASPFWLTFKQAQELGGHVRKGEKAFPVVFWKWLEVENDNGSKERVPFLRYYSVFNVAQCEGIEGHVPSSSETKREHAPAEAAECIVQGMPKRPEIKLGQSQAFYSPGTDFVGMPDPDQFRSSEDYYSVLFHELTHSTGHESRLNRKGVAGSDGQWSAFGSGSYAKEELVAEMGAAFLCGQAGIVERTIDNSAAYLASWLARLKDDPKLVVQAAAQAQKAADFILSVRLTGHEGE
jgi:antirestriction protein ArdC